MIHNRVKIESNVPAVPLALDIWMSGQEIFFISCSNFNYFKNGYLCVRQSQGANYITSCMAKTNAHNGHSIFMLFRLLPGSYRTEGLPDIEANQDTTDKDEEEDTAEADPSSTSATDAPKLETES